MIEDGFALWCERRLNTTQRFRNGKKQKQSSLKTNSRTPSAIISCLMI